MCRFLIFFVRNLTGTTFLLHQTMPGGTQCLSPIPQGKMACPEIHTYTLSIASYAEGYKELLSLDCDTNLLDILLCFGLFTQFGSTNWQMVPTNSFFMQSTKKKFYEYSVSLGTQESYSMLAKRSQFLVWYSQNVVSLGLTFKEYAIQQLNSQSYESVEDQDNTESEYEVKCAMPFCQFGFLYQYQIPDILKISVVWKLELWKIKLFHTAAVEIARLCETTKRMLHRRVTKARLPRELMTFGAMVYGSIVEYYIYQYYSSA
ncbi:hypothetical protein PHYBLDRAFT_68066 [Phycomyces blakesleeanus NRRL 1555(-)]|uniref:Uncharacterized protein n=1 Tax=Phycomyces blakesleeanus (strain ATCC 8743b / DSM 1359 / FGSC 10004 / NBRC 33097 / NRRL 1555) TaxID=763407 RepID=A0A162UN05_PHYB8|nr:hypothetical protein PHYBLDRAFT_68066 [Phycomyces blakesleeanus NRRL 1555(-)]OAD77122.1 hypothetical protein PHYBLDRAFT_68066 [Phycomyces blakesleeanus NRRL 1555(-)]|eukprot:XP_018295162.1 hypothetical protein PHYBLDRAFT_68066 [Phycomyces blakesleeanus NRRL 1555(-)]